jgi:PRC-barrel domain
MLNVKAIALGAALALTAAAGLSPAVAQQTPQPGQAENLIGMQVYTSDNQHLGQVIQLVSYNGELALRAEIGSFLGFGTTTVVIPNSMYVAKDGRIEVTMTAAEVRQTIDKEK